MMAPITGSTRRRLRQEATADWLGLAYRAAFLVLVTTPVWGTALALGIVWQHLQP